MMHPKLLRRLAALAAVFVFLPAFLRFSTVQPEALPASDIFAASKQLADTEQFCSALPMPRGEYLPHKNAQLSRPHPPGRTAGFRAFQTFAGGLAVRLPAAALHGCLLPYVRRERRYTERYILRYIHDQDGQKDAASVLRIF